MSESSRFSNRPNARIEVTPGRVLFDSRSVAVTAIVLAHDSAANQWYALVDQRGPAVDFADHWCLACGYLDWDEALPDAVRREVFEETGVDLRSLEASGEAIVPAQPIYVQSDPKAHRQNVTARFVVELGRRVPTTGEHAEAGEVLQVKWLEVTRESIDALSWAFHHDEILGELAAFYAAERAAGLLDRDSTRRFYRTLLEGRYPYV